MVKHVEEIIKNLIKNKINMLENIISAPLPNIKIKKHLAKHMTIWNAYLKKMNLVNKINYINYINKIPNTKLIKLDITITVIIMDIVMIIIITHGIIILNKLIHNTLISLNTNINLTMIINLDLKNLSEITMLVVMLVVTSPPIYSPIFKGEAK